LTVDTMSGYRCTQMDYFFVVKLCTHAASNDEGRIGTLVSPSFELNTNSLFLVLEMDDFGLEWKRLGVLFFFGELLNVCRSAQA
jgi:hypothetical protein